MMHPTISDRVHMPLGTVMLQRATADDEVDVIRLAQRLVSFGLPSWRDPSVVTNVDRKNLRASIGTDDDSAAVITAKIDGAIAGFVHVHLAVDLYRPDPIAHISDLVVDAAFEGNGLGRLLLDAAEQWAVQKDIAILTITAFTGNVRAIDIYERFGFSSDTVKLVKPLTEQAPSTSQHKGSLL